MKIKILWCLLASGIAVQITRAQLPRNVSADPSAQLRQLIQLPQLYMPSLNMPALPGFTNKPVMPGYNIQKAIELAKQMCPLLNAKPTLSLEGKRASDEKVALEWKTVNAFNSDAFDIERSLGDTLHFSKVNFVLAKGNKVKEKYTLPDDNNYDQLSYYRVKLLLMNGTSRYSNIAVVRGYDVITLYPNPSTVNTRIILSSKVQGTGKLCIIDNEGRLVQQTPFSVVEGYNQKDVDIAKLTPGVYMISVTMPDRQVRLRKLVKY